jgi:hypothetical protein
MACRPAIDLPRLLNKKACCLIKKRQYIEAVGLLMKALNLELVPGAAANSSNARVDNSVTTTSRSVPESSPDPSPQDTFHSLHIQDHQLEESSQSPYIYKEPAVCVTDKVSGDEYIVSFTIIFNLSLCFQLEGIENKDKSSSRKNLNVSKRLYETAFEMQVQSKGTNLLLTLALMNNLSLVNKALNNQYEAAQYNQLLLCALLQIVDRGGAVTEENKKVLDGFMGNVMHLVMNQAPVAPAA